MGSFLLLLRRRRRRRRLATDFCMGIIEARGVKEEEREDISIRPGATPNRQFGAGC